MKGVNGSGATFGKLLHGTVPSVRTVAFQMPFGDSVTAPNQIAMAKIDPVALFEKDFQANWET